VNAHTCLYCTVYSYVSSQVQIRKEQNAKKRVQYEKKKAEDEQARHLRQREERRERYRDEAKRKKAAEFKEGGGRGAKRSKT